MPDFDFSTFNEPPKPTTHLFKDLTANVYGRLTVIAFAGADAQRKTCWICRCQCGAVAQFRATNLASGKSRSCGCLRDESRIATKIIHGHHRKHFTTREYRSYTGAKNRCDNPNNPAYPRYGGRGIEFRFSNFPEFLAHLGPRPKGYSLDRIDNDGHYEPGNVRWADYKTQRANQRPYTRKSHSRDRRSNSAASSSLESCE